MTGVREDQVMAGSSWEKRFMAWGTHELSHEEVRWGVIDLGGGAHLLDDSLVKDHDPGGQGHRLDLVMGDINHGGGQGVMELLKLHPHLCAQRCIKVRERLIKQKDLRLSHQRSPDRHPLSLAARELLWHALKVIAKVQGRERPPRPARGFFGAGTFLIFSPNPMFSRTLMWG